MKRLILSLLAVATCAQANVDLQKIKVPPGFKIALFASRLPGARSMTWGSNGTLFVGTRERKVYAVDKSGKIYTIATGLNSPNGVAFKDGSLYVAEIDRIERYDHIETTLATPPKPVTITKDYPSDSHHG